jgi:hypothetical protein
MFQVGDKVRWSSQAGGVTVKKQGSIVEVVPPYTMKRTRPRDRATSRTHESYIVEVAGRTAKSKAVLYWPVVSLLSRAPAPRKRAPALMSPAPMPSAPMPSMAEPPIERRVLSPGREVGDGLEQDQSRMS